MALKVKEKLQKACPCFAHLLDKILTLNIINLFILFSLNRIFRIFVPNIKT